jgi:hypothetical protein
LCPWFDSWRHHHQKPDSDESGFLVFKEPKKPFPIVVEYFKGAISFSARGGKQPLLATGIIALDANVRHNLIALEDVFCAYPYLKEMM